METTFSITQGILCPLFGNLCYLCETLCTEPCLSTSLLPSDPVCSSAGFVSTLPHNTRTPLGHASLDRTINMPQRRTASATADEADAKLVMGMVELLNDGRVVQALKKQLCPKELCEKLDLLTAQMDNMTRQLAAKDERIQTLDKTVLHLEGQLDA